MENRLIHKRLQFEAAVEDFRKSLEIDLSGLDEEVIDVVKSGRAQKFELSVELLWKTGKVFLLDIHGIDENSPKGVIKTFYTLKYLSPSEFESVISLVDDRNSLSHIYKKEQFLEIYQRIVTAYPIFEKLLKIMA